MVIVRIVGGLGNQMFCYAFAKALENKGFDVKIDVSTYESYKLHGGLQLDKFCTDLEYSNVSENNLFYKCNVFSKILKRLNIEWSKVTKEKKLMFDVAMLRPEDHSYIEGYFQSEKYFMGVKDTLLNQFKLLNEYSDYFFKIENKILTSKNSCSVHIRRGDFLQSKNASVHGFCSLDYYKRALEHLENEVGELSCFVFSDDIEWCKQNLILDNATFIESAEKRLPHEDMLLMSRCHHNIIANSTFSWWGAWLNQYESKRVVAPKRWFADEGLESQSKDIVCESWIRL